MRRFSLVGVLALAAGTALVWGGAASAQPACGPRLALLEQLAEQFREVPVAVALTLGGGVLEVVASPAGTWTVLITSPAGVACLMTGGEAWQFLPAKPADPGKPS